MLGPSKTVTIAVMGEEAEEMEVDLVECTMAVRNLLERKTPRSRRVFTGFVEGDLQKLPKVSELEEQVVSWIEAGYLRQDDYVTALEETGVPAGGDMARILDQLQLLTARLDSLETAKGAPAPPKAAASPSSTNSLSSSSCVCQLCTGLELVADVGDFGRGLFWITETIRIYLFAKAGFLSALGSLGKRRDVSQSGQTKNAISGGSSSACASGRAEHCSMGRFDAEIRTDVETHLARVIGVIQDQV